MINRRARSSALTQSPLQVSEAGPRWRSLLFVPVLQTRFIAKAHERGADAIILDLEDSIADAHKGQARHCLSEGIDALREHGITVLVRINRNWCDAFQDLEAAVRPGVYAIVLPKVREAGAVRVACEIVSCLEEKAGVPVGTIGFVPMIEDAAALSDAQEIAGATDRIRAITLGTEDYALSLGSGIDESGLLYAHSVIVQAAAATGIVPLGLLGSIADFSDQDVFANRAHRSRAIGLKGTFLIHPSQVAIANAAFSPTPDQLKRASQVVEAYENNGGATGAFQLNGQMIDRPVYLQAKRLLSGAGSLSLDV